MVEQGKGLHELKSGMTKYPQTLINVRLSEKFDLDGSESVRQAVLDAEQELAETGRVLLRPSGTEPLVRVMVEGEASAQGERLAKEAAGGGALAGRDWAVTYDPLP